MKRGSNAWVWLFMLVGLTSNMAAQSLKPGSSLGGVSTSATAAKKAEPPIYFAANSSGFSASGRWVPSDVKDTFAVPSETEIDCEKSSKSCVEATAEYSYGHPHVGIQYFQVVSWTADGIVAIDSSAICMTRTIIISFPEKSITATRSANALDQGKKEACETFGATGTIAELMVIKNSDQWIKNPYGSGAQ